MIILVGCRFPILMLHPNLGLMGKAMKRPTAFWKTYTIHCKMPLSDKSMPMNVTKTEHLPQNDCYSYQTKFIAIDLFSMVHVTFLTAASCPRSYFYTNTLTHFCVLLTKKRPKMLVQNSAQEVCQKALCHTSCYTPAMPLPCPCLASPDPFAVHPKICTAHKNY